MVNFFIRRPVFATVCSLLIVLGGAVCIPTLPIAQYPNLTPPAVSVSAFYTGANSQAVETSVTTLLEQTINGAEATIKGRALSKSGDATPVTFSLHQAADGRWRVYDVSFEGMSLVGNYRAQFNKIIRATSFDELMTRLEAKTHPEAQASTADPSKPNAP